MIVGILVGSILGIIGGPLLFPSIATESDSMRSTLRGTLSEKETQLASLTEKYISLNETNRILTKNYIELETSKQTIQEMYDNVSTSLQSLQEEVSIYREGTLEKSNSENEIMVADFHLEIDTWHASDEQRTEYVTVKLTHNGSARAENVIIRGGGLGIYIQEEFDWLDPLEEYRYNGLTENREDDFGGVQIIWEYTDEHNETLVAVKIWRYGGYGVNLVNSSARSRDLLPYPEIVDYQQFVNDEGYIAVQINVKNNGKAGNILITVLFQGYDGISLWDRTDEMKVWIDEGEFRLYIYTSNMRPSTHTTIGVSHVSVSSSRAFLN